MLQAVTSGTQPVDFELKEGNQAQALESDKNIWDTTLNEAQPTSIAGTFNWDDPLGIKKKCAEFFEKAEEDNCTRPLCINKYTLPEPRFADDHPKHKYSDEEIDAAQDKYAKLTKEEQDEVMRTYKKAMRLFNMPADGYGTQMYGSVEHFLKKNPEYQEAFEIMAPIAQDYNNYVEEVAENYMENAPWYEKAALKIGIKSSGFKKAMENAKSVYEFMYNTQQKA